MPWQTMDPLNINSMLRQFEIQT